MNNKNSISIDEIVHGASEVLQSDNQVNYVLILHNGTKPEKLMEAIEKKELPYFLAEQQHYQRVHTEGKLPHYLINVTKI
jgi:hypothetical protein